MGKKKVLLAAAFVAIAMLSGGIVSIYALNKGSVEVRGATQIEAADMVRQEREETEQAEMKSEVWADEKSFSCGVSGCTETEVHQHGLCGIDGCTEAGSHTHNSCGVSGCTQTGEHSHGGNGGGHHSSGHRGGHH